MEPGDSTRKKKIAEEEDRISNLPQSVVHHILSFLDMKYVVRTSILSTKWRYVWTSIPFLNFDDTLFLSQTTRKVKRFQNFVDNVFILSNFPSSIQRFRLFCEGMQSKVYVYKWVLAALRRNVQEISLVINLKDEYFRPPTCLFTCKGLTKLKMTLLPDYPHMRRLNPPDSMSLPGLKTLKLSMIRLEGDDVLNKILSSCPVLESLTLGTCEFDQTNVDIYALKLKQLVLKNSDPGSGFSFWRDYNIKIYAPNLISFRCKDIIWTDYTINNLSALVKANIDLDFNETDEVIDEDGVPMLLDDEKRKVIAPRAMEFLRALHNVEALTLSIGSVEVISVAQALLKSDPIQLYNLRCLKLLTLLSRDSVNGITYLLNISPSIESLLLKIEDMYEEAYPYWDEVRPNSAKIDIYNEGAMSQCMLYHLKLVEIRGVQGRVNETMFLENLLKSCNVLEKIVLYTSERQSPHTKSRLMKFVEQLRCFPKASSCVTILLF